MDEENALIQSYIDGNTDAFQKLVRPYQEVVYTYLTLTTSSKPLAGFLFQEIMNSIAASVLLYKGDLSMQTWIMKIAFEQMKLWQPKWLFGKILLGKGTKSFYASKKESETLHEKEAFIPILSIRPFHERSIFIFHDCLDFNFKTISQITAISEKKIQKN